MKKKQNWAEFKALLDKYNIMSLYHFTDRANIDNIIKNGGLLSWKECEDKGIKIPKPGGGGSDSLSWQLDRRSGLQDYIRVCFTRHHPMMYTALNEGRITDCAILEIDPEVVLWEETMFADMNANKIGANVGGTISDLRKIHFPTVKEVNQFVLLSDEQPYYQAEILVKSHIPNCYIKNIENFRNQKFSTKQTHLTRSILHEQETPAVIISGLWKEGQHSEALEIATTGGIPTEKSKHFIENYIEKHKTEKKYCSEININKRFFKYQHFNGSYFTVFGNKGLYYVTATDSIYKASHAFLEKEFEDLLTRKHFSPDIIKEIGFLCQRNYEERMSMGVIIQVLVHTEPTTNKLKQTTDLIMKKHLFLPEDFDAQICFFTPRQIENNITNLSFSKKKLLFILMSKIAIASTEENKQDNISNILFSKRFQIFTKLVKKYNLPQD